MDQKIEKSELNEVKYLLNKAVASGKLAAGLCSTFIGSYKLYREGGLSHKEAMGNLRESLEQWQR
jgi:hypothetical protein